MTYSIIGILATVLLLITNRELFWNRENKTKSQRKLFLIPYERRAHGINCRAFRQPCRR